MLRREKSDTDVFTQRALQALKFLSSPQEKGHARTSMREKNAKGVSRKGPARADLIAICSSGELSKSLSGLPTPIPEQL